MPLRAYCKERSRITVSLGPSSALGEKDKKRGQNRTPAIEASRARFFFFRQSRFSPFPHNEEPGPRLVYSQTEKTLNSEIFLECYCVARKKKQSRVRKLNGKQERSRLPIFAVIGHNTINIPEIFQVLTIFSVPL